MKSLSRSETTQHVTKSVIRYWAKKVYSCYPEVGVLRRGRLRADIVAFNMNREVIICEVKSCMSDFSTDRKWRKYLLFCNKMYFCIHAELESTLGAKIKESIKDTGCGLIVVSSSGKARVAVNAKRREKIWNRQWILTKLAWAGGINRSNVRKRV